MKVFLNDFKNFAVKGNVMDLAVGVIIGQAFGKIVASLVANIVMPLLGVVMGQVSLSKWVIPLGKDNLEIGIFLQTIFDFLIIALSIFLFIKIMTKTRTKIENLALNDKIEEQAEVVEEQKLASEEVLLLTEIRDLLKK